jgi:hypothetical protein
MMSFSLPMISRSHCEASSALPELSGSAIESNSHLFDDWFDPIEDMIRGQVCGLIEEMICGELDAALSRPRYGRLSGHSEGSMTRRPRRNHTPAFKAKVAIAATQEAGEQQLSTPCSTSGDGAALAGCIVGNHALVPLKLVPGDITLVLILEQYIHRSKISTFRPST